MPEPKSIAECYAILELPTTATLADLKQAYRDLSKVWHPDRFAMHDERLRRKAEERLKEINSAYDRLRQHLARPPSPPRPGVYTSPKQSASHEQTNSKPEATAAPTSNSRRRRPPKRASTSFGLMVIVLLAAVTIGTSAFISTMQTSTPSSVKAAPVKAISYLAWYEAPDGEQSGAYQVELWLDHSRGDELFGWVSHVVEGVDDPTGRLDIVELNASNGKFSFRSSMLGEDISFSGVWRGQKITGNMRSTRVAGPWRATFKVGDPTYKRDYYNSREAWEKDMEAILRCCGPNAVRGERKWR